MSVEIALAIAGIVLPFGGVTIRMYQMISETLERSKAMHELAEKQESSTERLADVMEDLAELLRWTMSREGDPTPPPHVRKMNKK